MTLLSDTKVALGITSNTRDAEVNMLINAALQDMARVGIPSYDLSQDSIDGLYKHAVVCYCKAHFGMDNPERESFDSTYRQIVCNLINSGPTV